MAFEEQSSSTRESIMDQLDNDALELDAALALFEEGIELLRQASEELKGAETRVKLLVEQADGVFETRDFHVSDCTISCSRSRCGPQMRSMRRSRGHGRGALLTSIPQQVSEAIRYSSA